MRDPLQQFVERIELSRLPAFPAVVVQLLKACENERAQFQELAQIVGTDATLATKVISAANSAFYGLRKQVSTLDRTLVVLGLATVRSIALTSAVHRFFCHLSADDDAFQRHFWRHSLKCALAARALAQLSADADAEEAYLSGLLHDIGQLLLMHGFRDEYSALRLVMDDELDLLQEESQRFGLAHHEVGFAMLRNWALNPMIADAVLYHHEPVDYLRDAHELVRVVHVANLLAGEAGVERSAEAAKVLLGVKQEVLQDIHSDMHEQLEGLAASVGVDVGEAQSFSEREARRSRDEQIKQRLASAVKRIGYREGIRTQLAEARDERSLYEAIELGAATLFDIDKLAALRLDAEAGALRGFRSGAVGEWIMQLSVPLRAQRSVVSRCFHEATLGNSFTDFDEEVISIADRQIIDALDTEGMICLPLRGQSLQWGVLVLGCSALQAERLMQRVELLENFAGEAGRSLAGLVAAGHQQRSSSESQREDMHDEVRMLIHEAKNPLAIMKNYLHVMSTKLDPSHDAQRELTVLQGEIDRVGRIVEEFRLLGERPAECGGVVNLNELVRQLMGVLEESILAPAGIAAELKLDPSVPAVRVSRDRTKQILTNLIKNAAEALGQGGKIIVSTRDRVNVGDKEHVKIAVSDDGPGLPAEVRARLFEPIASSKQGGSGLGLVIVKSLVDQMGGLIAVHSGDKNGTAFEVLLPRCIEGDRSR